jgi:class 3 adenylate cyclase
MSSSTRMALKRLLTGLLKRRTAAHTSDERRAAILFMDIRDFTLVTARMHPRDVFAVVNRLLGNVIPIVERHGGHVEKLLGDGFMASFGLRSEHPEPALAAVRCAAAIRQETAWLNCTDAYRRAVGCVEPLQLEVGIGVAKGRVLCGAVGAGKCRETTAMGRTVNLASRLCALSGRGEIRCCNFTWLDIREHAYFGDGAEVIMKGLTEPIKTYRVEGLRLPLHSRTTVRRRGGHHRLESLDNVDAQQLATRVFSRIPDELKQTRVRT